MNLINIFVRGEQIEKNIEIKKCKIECYLSLNEIFFYFKAFSSQNAFREYFGLRGPHY